MVEYTILIVDDEKLIRWSLTERLQKEGFLTKEAQDGASALAMFEKSNIDLVLLDLKLPDTDGISILKKIKSQDTNVPAIIITAYSTIDTAVEAMKVGAYDYISKPFNMEELIIGVKRALEATSLKREMHDIVTEQKSKFGLQNLVGVSQPMLDIFELIKKIAKSDATTVLLRGESGTGKDLIARAIHYESARSDKPFMTITCTALQDTLLESELFGHEKGSFTDAKIQKKGLFELASGGKIFRDEIGDMPPPLQAKVLRVLEEKAFKRIGGTVDIKIDVRIIAATNRDLEKAVDEKKFRDDLYYRLNVVPMYIPPLRERRKDIPLLIDHFIGYSNREFRKSVKGVSDVAMEKLKNYVWPGNIRELRNAIERATLLGTGEIISADDLVLGTDIRKSDTEKGKHIFKLPQEGTVIDEVEKDLVVQALERSGYNQTRAAKLLGITRDKLRYRMEKFGLLAHQENETPVK